MFGRHPDITVNVDLGQLVGVLADIHRRLDCIEHAQHDMKEQAMADFTALNAALDGLGTLVARVDADFQALKDQLASDATDQAAVDAATAKVQASLDALEATDPTV